MGWNPILALPDYGGLREAALLPPPPTANLLLWMDADSGYVFSDTGGTIPATDGGSVGSWRDRGPSAHLFAQATIGNRPRFDENEVAAENALYHETGFPPKDFLSVLSGISPGAGDSSFYMVIKPENIAANKQVINGGGNAVNGRNGYGINIPAEQTVQLIETGISTIATSQSPLQLDRFTVVAVLHNNGTDVNFRFNGHSDPAVIAGAVVFAANARTVIGAWFDGTVAPYQGHIAEILLYNTLHSLATCQSIEAYLQAKYDIVAGAHTGFDIGFAHGFG